ncbi:putative molybdenum cofactor guanylyltransferase [Fulvitalea axinellae]|uniref:Probable molybdenum cofactor guanylyltransferase n=1 Tax=Fulvitalea axinellae TaxID=1182444 RepID=A0AAU9D4Z3_9BACT|nr:putative molybdenum cofactor guanylyltransferase [Fulvitalea axinellae]
MEKQRTGIILAGGKSSRMGRDKGLIRIEGKTFVQRIIDVLAPLVDDIIIVSDKPEYDAFGCKRAEDLIRDAGPLAGLYTGLHYSETEDNIVLSCDVPMVNTEVLRMLMDRVADDTDIVQLAYDGKTMPMLAMYKKRCEKKCLELLESGQRRLRTLALQSRTETVVLEERFAITVANINTPDDLKEISDENND